jgi:uncharacterized protein
MVTRGQFLERATVIPAKEGVLEGLSHRGKRAPPLLIVPPSPGSGGMDHAVCAELAWAASRGGHPTLRFNFRGVGASPGSPGGRASQVEDMESALRVLEENSGTVAAAVVCLGDSAAALLELVRLHPGLAGVALVSPSGIDVEELSRVGHPLLVVVGEREPVRRAALAASVGEAAGSFLVLPNTDARFQQGLTEVGRSVARWLESLAPSA